MHPGNSSGPCWNMHCVPGTLSYNPSCQGDGCPMTICPSGLQHSLNQQSLYNRHAEEIRLGDSGRPSSSKTHLSFLCYALPISDYVALNTRLPITRQNSIQYRQEHHKAHMSTFFILTRRTWNRLDNSSPTSPTIPNPMVLPG